MSSTSSGRTKVFISYSHKDAKYLERLKTHFVPYERRGLLSVWDDTSIAYGTHWRKEIEEAIKQTKVAILLVSADFLASKFIAENELPPLLAAAETEGAIIIPVILSACVFQVTELAQFQAVNNPSNPIDRMRKDQREKTWATVVEAVSKAINAQQQQLTITKLKYSEFENETQRAQQLVSERPRFWEYLLTAELLGTKLQLIKRRLNDLKKGLVYKRTTPIRGDEFIGWARSKCQDLASLIVIASNAINVEIPASWGPPGVAGEPLEIKRAVEKLIFVCNEMVDWETDVRFTIAPIPFESLKQKMEGWTSQYIAEVENFLNQMTTVLKQPNLTGTHNINLTFQPPFNTAEFMAELQRLQNNPKLLARLLQRGW